MNVCCQDLTHLTGGLQSHLTVAFGKRTLVHFLEALQRIPDFVISKATAGSLSSLGQCEG